MEINNIITAKDLFDKRDYLLERKKELKNILKKKSLFDISYFDVNEDNLMELRVKDCPELVDEIIRFTAKRIDAKLSDIEKKIKELK